MTTVQQTRPENTRSITSAGRESASEKVERLITTAAALEADGVSDFSIEHAAETIVDPRSRRNFREVSTSYSIGNYRSATVMLWSVVVCDLLFKLEEMKTTFSDATATKLLEDIEKMRATRPNSPEWEEALLSLVRERTVLLEEHEFRRLKELQQHRHLAAHPLLDGAYRLLTPTPEQARADIRTALESVLTKPPLMTRKILDALLDDLEANGDGFLGANSLRRYLKAKFFSHMVPAVSGAVFKSLWGICFRVEDDQRAIKNRAINVRALACLFDEAPWDRLEQIRGDRTHFSRLSPKLLGEVASFMCSRPAVFPLMNDEARMLLTEDQSKRPEALLNGFAHPKGWRGHLESLKSIFTWEAVDLACVPLWVDVMDREGLIAEAREIAIRAHCESGRFDEADTTFEVLRPLLPTITKDDLLRLMEGISSNRQIYARGRAAYSYDALQPFVSALLGGEADLETRFPKIMARLKLTQP